MNKHSRKMGLILLTATLFIQSIKGSVGANIVKGAYVAGAALLGAAANGVGNVIGDGAHNVASQANAQALPIPPTPSIAVKLSPEQLKSFASIDGLLAQAKNSEDLKKIYESYGASLKQIATSAPAASKEAIERLERLGDISLSPGPIQKSFDKVTDFAMNKLHLSQADSFIKNHPTLSKALAIYTLAGYAYIHIVKRYTAAQLPPVTGLNNANNGINATSTRVSPFDKRNDIPLLDDFFFLHVLWGKTWDNLTGNNKACFIL